VKHQNSLELIADVFERIERTLPRFQEYLEEFGSRDATVRFKEALVVYYAELLGHYQDSIKFLSKSPICKPLLPSE
jgi:hypothetical protein